jgi:hypothetical protein
MYLSPGIKSLPEERVQLLLTSLETDRVFA